MKLSTYIAHIVIDVALLVIGLILASQGIDTLSVTRILIGTAVMGIALYTIATNTETFYS